MIYRWLLLVSCLLLALLAQRGAAKSSSPKIAPPTKIDHKPSSLFYFEDTDTVLMNTVNGDLLRSVDAGETWSVVEGDDGGMKHHVLLIRQHPYDNKKAYALGPNGRHWVTTDQAKTWASFNIAEFPAIRHYPLVFHGGDSSKVIFQGEECAGRYCIVRSYYTTDDFATVKLLRESTGGCAWAVGHPQFAEDLNLAEEIKDRSFCVVPGLKVPLPHANRLVYSDDYFRGNAEGTETKLQEGRPVSGVISTAAVKKFIVAAAKSKGTEELALYVTVDAKNWHRAEFDGHRIEEDAYTMLESTNYSLQVDVLTSPRSGMGVLFTSNSNGTYFTRNIEHTNRNSEGMVDFEKIAGIQGIVLVNTVQNPEEVESGSAKKKITSRISFDDGRTFQPLKSDGENLHLHSVTALRNIGRVFSSPAPGLVMGIGNTGNHLQEYAECNLYISDDAGVTWRRALKHPHKYEFGDQGAVVIAVRDDGRVDKINYSLDHGKEWASVELQHKIYPTMVTTTPDSTSLKFIVVGSLKEGQDGEHVIYSIDFDGLHERKCEEGDFEKWPARLDEHGKPDCLMGHKQFYMRRRANANCFVDEEFKDPEPIFEACKCTTEDFECEYRRTEDGKGCVLPSPLTPPEGECKKPDDKFMGPSGWRLIPGDACIRDGGENLDKEIERSCKDASSPSTDGKIGVTLQLFEARDYVQYYYLERQSSSSGSDETIIMLSSEHEVYVTHDHGKTWERPLKGEKITRVYLHPYSSDVAFLLTDGKEGFWTEDRGHTFKPFQAPAPPTQDRFLQIMAFHPVHKDRLIWTGAVDCHSGDCHSDAFIKKERGKNWEPLLSYVQKCEFESRETRPNSTNLVYCEQFENQSKNGRLQLLSSDDFFNDNEVQFVDVINYATMSEFIIVASRQPENPDSLVASTSVDGRTFARAQFPPNVQVPVQTAYTVLESSTHAVFLHVTASSTEGAEYGPIIKSNSNGTSYVLSISAVNRNSLGYVDFEKAQGLEGVAVVNVVSNAAEVSKKVSKKLKTMITHNDGAQWMLLPPPAKDADGKSFGCSVVAGKGTDDCSLHLHGYTERKDERDTFASGSAIGLMMAVGNVGDHLAGGDEADTFITNDGGISWKSVKKGKYMWEYGDSGSVIVIVPESKPTKTIHYSLDEGDTWEEFRFSDVEVRINDISTVPSDTSKNFLLWARVSNSEVQDKFATFNIDFSGVRPRPCLLDENQGNSDDYYIWEPKHPFQENNCLFGHSEQYHRKKPSAQCWNDWRESHVHSIGTNCTCTRADYECDYNYEPQSDGSCALVTGLPKPNAMEICKKDPDTIEYWEPTGYRRIPQTTCQGGLNLDHFVSKPCPNKEEEYKQKHGISGVGLFFAIVTPLAAAGAAGYYAYSRWDGKFGQIRLGESAGTSQSFLPRDSWLVTVPIAIVAGTVAVARALPLLVTSLWRGASGFIRLGRGRGYSRPYASRGSFAARRGDYTSIVDDEDELLGVEDADLDEDDEA
ncbi:vacuolar protein sorting/targeting protein 10 [Aspergillus novoparasiticus]|uniref:Vacuolar protein sorting/targeting protein 10 n=1 Tax=Aspergillus novoparasiticus TaxID=986946 RepID=A0A5N6EN61_9EURO|nr:vacuolar protein sorting/targeting protein 10 [Aspergillus novoparasiticus]